MTDTNEHDGCIGTLREIEKDIRELEERNKETWEKTQEEIRAFREESSAREEKTREKIRAVEEELRAISDELTILSPLKPLAVSIQDGSFATFQSGEPEGEIEDHLASWIESNIELAADVVTDVCMFEDGLMHDNERFTALYGVDWQAAKELIGHPHMVSAMNKRANELAVTGSTEWAKEGEFDQLRRWTQNATPEELVDFTKDVGVTYPKQLFLDIMQDS